MPTRSSRPARAASSTSTRRWPPTRLGWTRRRPAGPRRAGARRTGGRPGRGGVMSPSYANPTTPAETAAASPQIADEAYRALEDIVGAANVSRDAAVLDTYAFQWLAELVRPDQSHYMPRPAAVVLPGLHRRGPGDRPAGQQVRPQGEASRDRLVPLVRSHQGRGRDAAARHATHERHRRDRRAEHVRRRRALRHRGPVAGGGPAAGPQPQHPRGRLLELHRRQRLRLPRRRPGHLLHGRQRGERARHGVGDARGRDRPHRLPRLGRRLVLQRGPRPVGARHLPGHARQPRRPRRLHQVRGQARPALRPDRVERRTARLPAYRLPVDENLRVYTLAVPDWDAWAEIYYRIYDNEIGYIFHRQFNLAGADLAACVLAHVQRPVQEALRRARAGRGPGDRRS